MPVNCGNSRVYAQISSRDIRWNAIARYVLEGVEVCEASLSPYLLFDSDLSILMLYNVP